MIRPARALMAALLMTVFPTVAWSGTDLSLKTIVVDAGHGGKDVGTMSADGKTYEKTLTLDISRKFVAKVKEAYPSLKVVMTRSKDEFIPLNTRAQIASDAGAQLFISIHINATVKKTPNGFTAYILGPSSPKSKYDSYDVNLEVCKRENSVIFLEEDYSTKYKDFDDSPESQILIQLMQNAFREQSLSFAEEVSDAMDKGPFERNWGVMQGNFAVLRRASMPAVLLEFGFMSNATDLEILRKSANIDKMVDNLFKAFVRYKETYDGSVSLEKDTKSAAPASEPKPSASAKESTAAKESTTVNAEPAPAAAKETPAPKTEPAKAPEKGQILYGTQILASAKKMSANDPYFKGNKVIIVAVGKLFKYIACPSEDRQEAYNKSRELRKFFPDSFLVKTDGEIVTAEK